MVGDVKEGEAGDHVEDVLADALGEVAAEGGLVHLDDRAELGASPRCHRLVPLTHAPPAASNTHIGKTADLPEHLLLPVEAHGGQDEGDLGNILPQQPRLARPGQGLEVLTTLQEDDDQLYKKLLQGAIRLVFDQTDGCFFLLHLLGSNGLQRDTCLQMFDDQ